jgi:ABC-type lipoprotein release transport system permease subunit
MRSLRLALRNLGRNRWRSALTIAGVATAVATIIWLSHFVNGMLDQMARSVTRIELGDLQIQHPDYVDDPSLFHGFRASDLSLDAVRAQAGVAGAAPRVKAYGLVGHERQSRVVRLVGVDPRAERAVSDIPDRVTEGDWLSDAPPDGGGARQVVLGASLARVLDVEPGDELVVLLQAADGSLGNDTLEVQGIARTGSTMLDGSAAWMHLADVQWLAALDGRLHEVAVAAERGADLDDVRDGIAAGPAGGLSVRTWMQIVPDFHQLLATSQASMWIMYLVVYLVAALGLLNTQRMTALERRREFGVLLAIGTTPTRLARQVTMESVVQSLLGGLLGAVVGTLATLRHQVNGFDTGGLATDGDAGWTYMGVSFDVIYFHLDWAEVLAPALLVTLVGLLCGLWPAITSARLDMSRAIAGRQ